MFREWSSRVRVIEEIVLNQHDTANRFPSFHQVEAFVELLELQSMRNQRIEQNLFLHVPVDDLWQFVEASAAHVAAGPLPAHHQMCGRRANVAPVRCNADDVATAPREIRALEGLAHRQRIADAFETVVRTAARQFHQVTHELRHGVRLQEFRRAELARNCLLGWIRVDADDGARASELRALHDVQSNAAEAEYDDTAAGFDACAEERRAQACRRAASDVANGIEWRVLTNFGDRVGGDHRVIGERPQSPELADGLAFQ